MAVNDHKLKGMAQQGHRGAKLALRLLEKTDYLLGAVLLGNNFVNSAAAALSTIVTFRLFGNQDWVLGIATIGVTVLILIFAETTPKTIAAAYATQLSVKLAYPLFVILMMLYPFVYLNALIVSWMLKLFGLSSEKKKEQLTLKELQLLALESTHFQEKRQWKLFENLFSFNDLRVDDLMVMKKSIEFIDLSTATHLILAQIKTAMHSDIIVCNEGMDNVLGLLNVRSFLSDAMNESPTTDAEWLNLITTSLKDLYFIPQKTTLLQQLSSFQELGKSLGLVVDEYGDVIGLLTKDDLLSLMADEFITPDPLWGYMKIGVNEYIVDASTSLRALNERLAAGFDIKGPKTLNGLITDICRTIPTVGEIVHYRDFQFEILQVDEKFIRRVKVSRL
jgi:Mg2+/Co2+ transporter CorB